MRHVVMLLCLLALAACGGSPKPFAHDPSQISYGRQIRDKVEVAISPPRNMPPEMGERVAAALAIELQSYGIVATVAPAEAPIQIDGVMSTRDADMSIEVQTDWRIRGRPRTDEPATVKTRAPPEDYAQQAERLISRIAQQAAPKIATLIGKPPNFIPRAPGQVAAGITIPYEFPPDPAAAPPDGTAPTSTTGPTPAAAKPAEPQVKAFVAAVTGAPSDGNRQLTSGMRRALGSSKLVIVDQAEGDAFSVVGTVTMTPIDDRMARLVVKWIVKDPAGRNIGDIDQSNPVPLAAAKGSWAGFGDIVASAAAEGVLELLEKAINKPR
ncbi:hypothetical protein [Reyranella sp.]|jgi:hypothetical protein|uniref:hypothetical protein n=1 Tax=Reyranella sp. TaxID=1929291 RepID=UPI000BC47D06|nr:hypothetical protein [Reyranella sp.]OYY38263.1 MAG: hypothetical protein B7Y57_21875 [Rhodospirillales bacterium 35-66-84]OYZ92007.1 MAG: hypothetical protein B7Y08_23370 [Rhodospirillales bacterium 24-66-33]OZB23369.1 MAG: hypothetical protein B7X63_19630 [Rhodospirillales bacterium 39-66-50]HQS17668.1 hypothetical protein [Reyranella sp.]HQT14486.1 hypothetical protein [Reyranella sp.]